MLAFGGTNHGDALVLLVSLSAFCHSLVGNGMWEKYQLLYLNQKTAAKKKQRGKDVSFMYFLQEGWLF